MIRTERLILVPLGVQLTALLSRGDLAGARALDPPFDLDPTTFADDTSVLVRRRRQLDADPDEWPWLLHAAVRDRAVVGRIGFHARPDADGAVEIGYSVGPVHRRQGYATEMARGLIGWGREQGARSCLASAQPDNAASLAVIARLGFVRTGEQIDDDDGLEWVFTLPL